LSFAEGILKKFRDDVTVITRLEACVTEPRSGGRV